MPIRNSDGEIIGVAQAINKSPSGALFTEDDEKVTVFNLKRELSTYSFGKLLSTPCPSLTTNRLNKVKCHTIIDKTVLHSPKGGFFYIYRCRRESQKVLKAEVSQVWERWVIRERLCRAFS